MGYIGLGRSAMRHGHPILTGLLAALLFAGLLPALAAAQYLPAPAPPAPGQAILPTGISEEDVEMFGRFCYVWQEPSGTQVIQYEGEFALDMGQRRVRSGDAVVWISRARYQGRIYASLQIFLWRDAQVIEPGGTVTRGDVLFATLNTFGKVRVNSSATALRSAEDTSLYRQAVRARESVLAREGQEGPTQQPLTVLRTRQPGVIRPHTPDRRVLFRADNLESATVDGQTVVTITGNVYIAQGQHGGAEALELRADAAVLWAQPGAAEESFGESLGVPSSRPARKPSATGTPAAEGVSPAESPVPRPPSLGGGLSERISAAYLEGDVVLTMGERMVRARRLFYNFENDQAYILDAVVRETEPTRGVPFYVRAQEVRQIARNQYVADNAKITTDEFYVPHYAIGAERVVVVDRTPRNAAGQVIGVEAGSFAARDITFNVDNHPLLWWPYARGDVRQGDLALRSWRTWFSNEFGISNQTRWNLFSVLGMLEPEGVSADLRLDYYGKRGPGAGIDANYQRQNMFGTLRSYYVFDQGTDTFGEWLKDLEPSTENRGEILWRHRQYLPQDWQLTLEFSYLSDINFQREYFPEQYYNEKPPENVIYLKKQKDNWAFTALADFRLNDFLTQSESYPDFTFYLEGEPLLGDKATLFAEARAGLVRYQPDSERLYNYNRLIDNTGATHVTPRADVRVEPNVPVDVGNVRVVPYGVVRGTYWGRSEVAPNDEGAIYRDFFNYGLRSSAYAWSVFDDVNSRLLDLYRLRHVVKEETTFWFSDSNWSSRELTPFTDGVETIDDFSGFTAKLRNLFQTQRGGAGRWRSVDWITFDLILGLFNNPPDNRDLAHGNVVQWRPEDSIARDFVQGKLNYRISDTTMLLYDATYDFDYNGINVQNLTLSVERDPRLSYFLGWRQIETTQSNLFGFGANYKATEKHTFAFREYYDIQRSKVEDLEVSYIRKLPRWYVATTFQLDNIQDDIGVSISAWPEGIPEATLGGRRFTGIPDSIGIRP